MARWLVGAILLLILWPSTGFAAPASSEPDPLQWSWSHSDDLPTRLAVGLHVEPGPDVECLWEHHYRLALNDADVPYALVVDQPVARHTFTTAPNPATVRTGSIDVGPGEHVGEGAGYGWIRFGRGTTLHLVLAAEGLYREDPADPTPLTMAVECDGPASLTFDVTSVFIAVPAWRWSETVVASENGPAALSVMRNASVSATFDTAAVRGGLYQTGGVGEAELRTPQTTWRQPLDARIPMTGGPGAYGATVDRTGVRAEGGADQMVLFLHGWD